MQNNPTAERSRHPAIQQALTFGLIAGVVFAINALITYVVNLNGASGIISLILFLVGLFLYTLAGFRASQRTGKVGSGAIAGLFTGLIGGLIGLVVNMIVVVAIVNSLRQVAQVAADQAHKQLPKQYPIVHLTNGTIIVDFLILAAGLLAFAIGLGAGFGAIGGVIGRRRAPQTQAPYQEALYQGTPPTTMNPSDPYNQQLQPDSTNPGNSSDPYVQGYPPTHQPPSNAS